MPRKAVFIAATGQNVGKTTVCLGLVAALKKKFPQLGFMKPVGQQHEKVENGLLVDKDVVLFKEYFHLLSNYEDMSPVIFPRGFTRNYLDGKVEERVLQNRIQHAFLAIFSENDFTIVEGTGHVGVGSIVNLNNAAVAKLLNLEIVLIARGGLGSAFDELALNKAMCDAYEVKISGVILNRVHDEKREMIVHYMKKALERWKMPLLGIIPYNHFLSTLSMEDFETLFNTKMLSGEKVHYRHFEMIRLVATSRETFMERILPNQLIVTPATREDIVETLIEYHTLSKQSPEHGFILTGRHPPSLKLIEKLKKANIPSLYTADPSFKAMEKITSYTGKIRKEDTSKVQKAIEVVGKNLNLNFFE